VLRAAFIGINEHGDPRIRSLMGARRDATALWALVSDSVPEAAPMLLTDREATGAAIAKLGLSARVGQRSLLRSGTCRGYSMPSRSSSTAGSRRESSADW
jgi:hypothetical protein